MTEKIQKAIDKIDGEAEKLNNVNARVIASHIIDTYLNSDETEIIHYHYEVEL